MSNNDGGPPLKKVRYDTEKYTYDQKGKILRIIKIPDGNEECSYSWNKYKSEVKKIVWPSWKQVLKNTLVVLVVVVICAIIIGALDYAFSQGIIALTKLFS